MNVPQITLYAKAGGVEIGPFEKRSEGKPREGRVSLRFFSLEPAGTQIRFVVEPSEAFQLFRRMEKVATSPGKETITHKFEGSDGEVVTRLVVEAYERNGKHGYAMGIQRANEGINVPLSNDHFHYAAEFLRHLSLTQAWVEQRA